MSARKDEPSMSNLLGGLPKASLRGLRKCPKCGTWNGTRGYTCKNKKCKAEFRNPGVLSKKLQPVWIIDAVKIVTDSSIQLFSVRVRDKGPDYRGFVQLPIIQDLEGNPTCCLDTSIIGPVARCYVDSCENRHHSDYLKESVTVCNHVRAALACTSEARPIDIKMDILQNTNLVPNLNQLLFYVTGNSTAVVQKVTKTVLAVKCKMTPKNPAGFLHVSLNEKGRLSTRGKTHFHCPCNFKYEKSAASVTGGSTKCIHFYACMCAFASHAELSREFLCMKADAENKCPSDDESDGEILKSALSDEHTSKPEHLTDAGEGTSQTRDMNLRLEEGDGINPSDPETNETSPVTKRYTVWTFESWLASITEHVNETMCYQHSGKPDPLVFYAPEMFWQRLQERLSALGLSGGAKKRLPNSSIFVKRKSPPLGLFEQITYKITNVIHLKQLLDTSRVALQLERHFSKRPDGTYAVKAESSARLEARASVTNPGQVPIAPVREGDFRTFLKVGTMSPDQRIPYSFTILWTPMLLPDSGVGELRIIFEFGHQRNGQMTDVLEADLPVDPRLLNSARKPTTADPFLSKTTSGKSPIKNRTIIAIANELKRKQAVISENSEASKKSKLFRALSNKDAGDSELLIDAEDREEEEASEGSEIEVDNYEPKQPALSLTSDEQKDKDFGKSSVTLCYGLHVHTDKDLDESSLAVTSDTHKDEDFVETSVTVCSVLQKDKDLDEPPATDTSDIHRPKDLDEALVDQ